MVSTHADEQDQPKPTTVLCPDFPFAYDEWVQHPAGLGALPAQHHGAEVAVIGGGISGLVTAYELMKLGLRPVVYEADQLGGRMRSVAFEGHPEVKAEMGAMRFPPSATLFHYVDKLGLKTKPFPNPLSPATPSTVVNLRGVSHWARTQEDLPEVYQQVSDAWAKALQEKADMSLMEDAIARRDVGTIKALWNHMVPELDNQSFYGFLASSAAFSSFEHREIFGQVGFGCGGWDTDFTNSMLDILRVVYTEASDRHHRILGGCQQVPTGLWEHRPESLTHWPAGTSLASLHGGTPRPAVVSINRTATGYVVQDSAGEFRKFPAAVYTAQSWNLLSRIKSDPALLPQELWTAVERTHYMGSSKLFVLTDRPFWRDRDPKTGRDVMSMTLTDRLPRGVYLFDDGPDKPGVMCLSYTWNDDSLKVATLTAEERLDVILASLKQIYPDVDIRSHIIAPPVTITWETEPYFMGAFKSSLPGHYRYQRELFTHFMQEEFAEEHRGFFMAGDDISWVAGFAENAVTTALNAVWGVINHLGGATHPDNPGPGDLFDDLAPLKL
ncbi:FAD-dependent oxidoreductase [Allokutzneria sp. A3M-2-11 16]|uniref:flavin monoamine oxidase family protein n=1 Tax=Allokutzneria sp. A3M-2-11 16 TaxID=2962043 RepID=UPI0020B79B81|nr:NAD(P)/FAD-dependent oxidoreductase [Allokutzneria sp. A3M-2-11 16]MCP3804689.1 FAD-dependent oxidoreductase [Allokutzneria sp. A3M-2-11 16]